MSQKRENASRLACFGGLALTAYLALVCCLICQTNVRRRPAAPVPAEAAPVEVAVSPGDVNEWRDAAMPVVEAPPLDALFERPNPDGLGGVFRSPSAAAELAAWYANEKCLRQWRHAPFSPGLYLAYWRNDRWYWGEYDPAGPGGFSAEVSFAGDGSGPQVQINFSIDTADQWPISQ